MRARGKMLALAGVALAVVACEALFDDPIQCRADADCARFGAQAKCDVIQGVCASRSAADDSGVPNPTQDAGSTSDAAEEPPPFDADKCGTAPRPVAVVPAAVFAGGTPAGSTSTREITQDTTLTCDKEWLLQGYVYVRTGVTLTIEPGTTIKGDKTTNGGLFIQQGGKLVANGLATLPIVFTSSVATGTRAAGDWRGIGIAGNAPRTGTATLLADPNMPYGGANADDTSGSLKYVRIEYSGIGLQFAGVGRATVVDFVQVRKAADNCFYMRGGRVNVKHLACQHPGDEAFEFDLGYDGRAQFLVAQRTPLAPSAQRNGALVDGATLRAYNMTLCGTTQNNLGTGLVVRNSAQVDIGNSIVTRYNAGFDLVGDASASLLVRSLLFKNNVEDYSHTETDAETDAASPLFDDDDGFDENAFLEGGANAVREAIPGCDNADTPVLAPTTSLTAGARALPNDPFFDNTATYIGAFKDATDRWAFGTWAVWSAQ